MAAGSATQLKLDEQEDPCAGAKVKGRLSWVAIWAQQSLGESHAFFVLAAHALLDDVTELLDCGCIEADLDAVAVMGAN